MCKRICQKCKEALLSLKLYSLYIVFKGDNKHVHDLLTTSKKNFQIYDWIQEI